MRVLVFTTSYLNGNTGSEVRARLLATGLIERGMELGFVAPDRPGPWAGGNAPSYSWVESKLHPRAELKVAVAEFKPDVIFGITEGLADLAVKTCEEAHCASVFDLHGIGVVEILELGAGYGAPLPRIRGSLRYLWSIRRANGVTVANPTLLPIIRRLNARATLAAGCADLERFSPEGSRIELGPSGRIQVLYAGNLLRWQGVDLLLKACERMIDRGDPYDFTLIGTFGSTDSFLRQHGRLIESGHLRLRPPVAYDEMPEILRSADVLVIPRPWMLSTYLAFPQKISDYMAAGRAILATDLKPHRYAIKDGETGILCKPNPEALAAALLRLRSPELRDFLGRNARRFAEQRLSSQIITQSVAQVLEEAVRDRGRGEDAAAIDSASLPVDPA